MAVAPGTRLGVYEGTAQIGVGGMGEVYQATDTTLNRQVAIKVLPEEFAAAPDRLMRFAHSLCFFAAMQTPRESATQGGP